MARSITQYTGASARKGKADAKAAARCKPKTCPRCGSQECIERPRFFCGQLLTDKDLDAAQRYVIEKNRLHNRYLVGKGVVCGLVVRCEPCDGESVVVEPGYAIDCCGNDVVVCDPEPFNVIDYIEECFGSKKPDCDGPVRTRRAVCDEGPKEYCLVLSYAEELSQKSTALVRDKGCQESRCEFSRVRETFRLDLVERSSLPKNGQPNLWTRIADCLPDTSKKMGLAAAEYYALDFQGAQGRDSAERELVRRVRRSVAELYRNGPDIRCNIDDLLCRDEPVVCPTVAVQCPQTALLSTVTNITYTAVLTGADSSITPTYNWTVSAGTIVSGQGTAQIVVNANIASAPAVPDHRDGQRRRLPAGVSAHGLLHDDRHPPHLRALPDRHRELSGVHRAGRVHHLHGRHHGRQPGRDAHLQLDGLVRHDYHWTGDGGAHGQLQRRRRLRHHRDRHRRADSRTAPRPRPRARVALPSFSAREATPAASGRRRRRRWPGGATTRPCSARF